MKLLIDAGNTRIKWQLRDGKVVRQAGSGRLEAADLFQGMTPDYWKAISSVSVSTVRSEGARQALESVISGHCSAPLRFFWTQATHGQLVCAYSDPSTMGADRWHALVGAWDLVRGGCAVVDAGSAITIDWIDSRGHHLGGYILPGRNMMTGSLRQGTARVLFDSQETMATTPGLSTAECVFHGVNWMIKALSLQLGRDLDIPVLITGGDGALIQNVLDNADDCRIPEVQLRPDLVLDGLALVEAG